MNIINKFRKYKNLEKELHEYFDYDADHCSGFNSHLDEYWKLNGKASVSHGPNEEEIDTYITDIIAIQEKEDATMIHGDFGTGDTFMMIFDNKKRVK